MINSLRSTCSCALCTSLYGQISLLISFPAAKLHSVICSHCAASLLTILPAILFVTMCKTQASVCVTGNLGGGNQQGPVGGESSRGRVGVKIRGEKKFWMAPEILKKKKTRKMMERTRSSHNESPNGYKTSVPDVLLT